MNLIEQLNKLNSEIQKAQVEEKVREEQLNELRPKRAQLEADAEKQFGCKMSELSNFIAEKEQELSDEIESLTSDIEKAKNL